MQAERPTRVRWLIFTLACATSWLLYLHRYAWGVIKPDFAAENPELTAQELGWLDSAFSASYAVGQVPGGLAGDFLGARAVLTGSILVWSVWVAAVAWTGGFWPVFAIRSAFGLSQAGAYPVLNKATRSWFPLAIRTSVQGAVTASGRLGAACTSILLGTLLMGALGLSWQNALLAIAVPGVVLAVVFWVVVRDSPSAHPWTNAAERELIGERGPTTVADSPVRLSRDPASLFGLAMLCLYAFASTFQDQLYVNWVPTFLAQGKGLGPAERGWLTTLPLLGGAIGGIMGGVLNDVLLRWTGNRRWSRSAVAITGKLLSAVLVMVCVRMEDGRSAMMVLFLAKVFGDWSLPTQWGAITDMSGRASATVFGVVNTVGSIGGFVAGPVLGTLKDHYGWEGLFGGAAAMCLLASACWLFIDCRRRIVTG